MERQNRNWCLRLVPASIRLALRSFFQSEAFGAVRVYVKASFSGGGVLTGGGAGSAWGRYAADAFLPAPVDLEGTVAVEEVYGTGASDGGGHDDDDRKGGGGAAAAVEEELRRLKVEGRGVKPWPTPWYLGWYIRRWFCGGSGGGGGGGARGRCRSANATQCCVALPWTLLLVMMLLTLAIVAVSVKAYLLCGFVVVFFLLLPLLYHLLARTIHSSFMGLLLVDLVLIVAFTGAFLLSLSVASYYLGYVRATMPHVINPTSHLTPLPFPPHPTTTPQPVLIIILAANLLTHLAHVPAIRDRPCPPPQDHAQSLAFNAKRVTHRIITTARAWSWASIIILLVLVGGLFLLGWGV